MSPSLQLPRYSFGTGDRFAHQAKAQLRACMKAAEAGVEVSPVWNKSFREHSIIGSTPASQRKAADEAVKALGWNKPYFVDADHINLKNVDVFLEACDFYTIDVADEIGKPAGNGLVEAFIAAHPELLSPVTVSGLEQPIVLNRKQLAEMASKYLGAVKEAGRIYRHIESRKGAGAFVTEISMDETDAPQTPPELLVILAAVADEGIPAQTIAPKFTGRFNKGVDYVGDAAQFEKEFAADVAVIAHAVRHYRLPSNLKLSVHSGSDKFSIYGAIRRTLQRTGAGVHLKTAGTTWLEEIIGLAEAGGKGLQMAKKIYAEAFNQVEALCAPYASVIDIDSSKLPPPSEVDRWSPEQFTAALRHNPACPAYSPHMRQLLHVGYKVAAKLGAEYLTMLEEFEEVVGRNVTENLFERHLKPVFLAG